jgi:hypothetical protein
MIAKNNFFRTAGLLAGALTLAANPLRAAETDALPTFDENYIKVSAAGMDISGSRAAAQRRTQLPKVGAAGIEAFNVTRELSKVTTMQVDGQALPGAEDYLAQFRIQKNEVGSFEVGYKTFRTFYDGVGGFFPTNKAWVPLQKRALYIDRGKFYVDGIIALPKAPVFRFRYTNSTRDGRKDSTIWGDTSFTGIPNYSLSSLNPVSIARKFLPSYNQIDERRETIEGTVTHPFGKTTAMLSLVGTRIDNLNTRSVDRFVGELRPFPTIPANPVTVIAPELSNNPNIGLDTQGVKEDSWAITAKVETALSDTVSVYGGVSYRTSDGDFSASRLINLTMRSNAGPISGIGGFTSGGRPPYSYTTAGTVKMDIYTANLGVNLKPSKDLAVDLGVKAEDTNISSNNLATYISTYMNQTTGLVATPQRDLAPNWSKVTQKVWSPEINARYTGINKVSLFGSVDYRSAPGDERHLDTHVGPGPAGSTVVAAAVGSKEQKEKEKYLNSKIGAVWAPSLQLNLRGEVFSKDHENRFEGYGEDAGELYVLDYDIVGARITATLRPIANWSFLTRYTTQTGKAAVLTDVYAKGDSKDAKRHTISETVNWTPNNAIFVQGDVNLVFDTISTAYPKAGDVANDVLRNADNNYWTGNLLLGFVVDKVTNATLQGSYYKANNYEPSLAAATMPYGAGGREYSISCGVTRKFSDRWLGSAKVGYFDSRNDTAGGNSDFKGPLAYLSMQHAF